LKENTLCLIINAHIINGNITTDQAAYRLLRSYHTPAYVQNHAAIIHKPVYKNYIVTIQESVSSKVATTVHVVQDIHKLPQLRHTQNVHNSIKLHSYHTPRCAQCNTATTHLDLHKATCLDCTRVCSKLHSYTTSICTQSNVAIKHQYMHQAT